MTTVITGAANGLGRALALACIERGESVLAIDLDAAALAEIDGAQPLAFDLTAPDAAQSIIAALETPVACIIHCAGISGTGRFEDIPAEHHARIMALNFTAPVQITAALLAANACAPTAKHVFVGSLSTFTGYPGATSYAASKDGLSSFTHSLRKSLPRGMSSHCVYPGPLRTDHAARYAPDNSEATVARRQSPEEAAALILTAMDRRRRAIFPGWKTRAFAFAGRILPGPVGRTLRQSLFETLKEPKL
ncbi:SDR family NAD(P)-dependent oxidoreductase [Shimia ponticola]|uniref:SDR family NAD(P)-dependent oxidoreductase n=1 Tax=Shimia ponticola TaxID=2582893 RepID=UPI0011BE5D7D|nr:SDR family NAD(P)-dependent oxidoreductase [Shimia ponticola]